MKNAKGITTAEFKLLCPELGHLEGDALWDAMTHYLIEHPELQSQGEDKPCVADYSNWGIMIPLGKASGPVPIFNLRLKDFGIESDIPEENE